MLRIVFLHIILHSPYVGSTPVAGTTAQGQPTTASGETAQKAAKTIKRIAEWVSKLRIDCPQLGLLVIGETGVGKSTLINNLLGEDVAGVGHDTTSATSAVSGYEGVIEGVHVKVYDTPGVGDSRSDRDNEYLEEIKKLIITETIHLIIYCLKMTETRMRYSIIRTFHQYTKIGVDWKKTVIALTFADALKPPSQLKKRKGVSDKEYFEQRLAEWKVEIPQRLTSEIQLKETNFTQIKVNPTTGDYEELLPNDEEWYIPFWLDILEVLPPAARIRFVDIHKDNIIYGDKETREAPEWSDNIHLLPPSVEELHSDEETAKKSSQHSDDVTSPPPSKLARKSDYTLPPVPKESFPPSYKPSMQQTDTEERTIVAAKGPFLVHVSIFNQAPDTISPSISLQSAAHSESTSEPDNGRMKKPVIKLEGER